MGTNQHSELAEAGAAMRAAADALTATTATVLATVAKLAAERYGAAAISVEVRYGDDATAEILAVCDGTTRPLYDIDVELAEVAETAALLEAEVTALLGAPDTAPTQRTITAAT